MSTSLLLHIKITSASGSLKVSFSKLESIGTSEPEPDSVPESGDFVALNPFEPTMLKSVNYL